MSTILSKSKNLIIRSNELVITTNLNGNCEFNLAYKINYQFTDAGCIWVDAHTNNVLKNVTSNSDLIGFTINYGEKFVENYTDFSKIYMQNADRSISIYDLSNTSTCIPTSPSVYSHNLIRTLNYDPTITNWPASQGPGSIVDCFRALYITDLIMPEVNEIFAKYLDGKTVKNVHIGLACPEFNARYITGISNFDNAYFTFGTYGDPGSGVTQSFMFIDLAAHEFGHMLAQEFLDINSVGGATLIEFIADAISIKVELKVKGNGFKWRMIDEDPNNHNPNFRDLSNPKFPCLNASIKGLPKENKHDRMGPYMKWYTTVISYLGEAKAFDFLMTIIKQLSNSADFTEFQTKSLDYAKMTYGVCSEEYIAILNGFNAACFTNLPTCVIFINGPHSVCEEYNHFSYYATGGLGGVFTWALIGPKCTEFIFSGNQTGNSHIGPDLTCIQFPTFEYYPRSEIIRLTSTGGTYVAQRRLIIRDCDGDDPTCTEHFNPNTALKVSSKKIISQSINLRSPNKFYLYEIGGRLIFEGNSSEFINFYNSLERGIYFKMSEYELNSKIEKLIKF